MSRYEEDNNSVSLQIRLREINRKAKASNGVQCDGLHCEEIPYEEVLLYANSADARYGDQIREHVIGELIKNDFENDE